MKIPKKIKPQIIYLEWCDSTSYSGWKYEDEMDEWCENDKWIVRQVGLMYRETPEYIVIAGRWSPPDETSMANYGNIQKIPKTWIKKRIILKDNKLSF